MAKLPYPLEKSNDMSLDKYLLNLLTAIVKKQGGELRLTTSDIMAVDGYALSKAPTEKLDAIVLRTSPAGTETYFVAEPPAWTTPTPQKTRVLPTITQPRVETQHHESVPKTNRSRQLDDMAAYLKEQEMAERLLERQRNQQAQDLRETGVYPWRNDSER